MIRILPIEDSYLRLGTALAIEWSAQWAARRYVVIASETDLPSEPAQRHIAYMQ